MLGCPESLQSPFGEARKLAICWSCLLKPGQLSGGEAVADGEQLYGTRTSHDGCIRSCFLSAMTPALWQGREL